MPDEFGAGLTHEYADVNGVRLHYAQAGKGPLMLFLHGYPRNWYLWRHQLAEFAQDRFVVAIDQRGYNLSSKPERDLDYGVWLAVEDIRELVDRLGHEKFVLVAHDWGGAVAWSFALHHADRLEALVVMSAAHPVLFERELRENPQFQEQAKFVFGLRDPNAPELLADNDFAALRQATLEFAFITDDDRDVYLEAWRQPGAMRAMLAIDRREGLGPPTEEGMPARGNYAPEIRSPVVAVPTLAMYTTEDPFNSAACFRGLERLVPDLTVKALPGTHWLPEEQPDVVNDSIRDFLGARTESALTR